MTAFFAEIGGYLILAAVAFLGTLGYGMKKKSDGKKEAINENAMRTAKAMIDDHKETKKGLEDAKEDIANESESERVKRLRERL